ncbi:Ldh family oxidoreductase [Pseudarthrobacter sp. fls2-241-R2A-168]|uniref:Ldh family oxidoreductase n=1 Tax=Pseudarthrobacter sp. fls2-241-R2A-168 TaxID=3040304 RepID=UPI002552F421|nr:Ldh family oxidoreductase [Pseudarthrobacter sp. fls2-241-R2A-168]
MQTPTRDSYKLLGAEELRLTVTNALVKAGATVSDAQVQANQLVDAELRGHASHGIRRVPVLCDRLHAGLIVSGASPDTTWVSESVLDVDGNLGFGPVSAHAAIDELLPRAASTGVALAAIRRSHHIGMLAPYVERMASAGFVSMVMTTSEGLVHPWGGAGALVGTNPIGIGVPSGDTPLILDMSTAAVSMGKILDYKAKGLEIPHGWAVDRNGRPTTDAAAASEGAISPFGGAKGYALGIAVEAIVGLLTRTAFGTEVTGTLDATQPTTKGDLFLVISTDVLRADESAQALARYFEQIRGSGVDSGVVSIPGDRARRTRTERLEAGVPVDGALWATIQAACQD